jgi:hypothetical protein
MPAALRMMLRPPSQPSRYCARSELVGVDTEARQVAHRDHPNRQGVAVGERNDRAGGLQRAAEHVQGLRGPRDVRYDEVERTRARHETGNGLLYGREGESGGLQREVGSFGLAIALSRSGGRGGLLVPDGVVWPAGGASGERVACRRRC